MHFDQVTANGVNSNDIKSTSLYPLRSRMRGGAFHVYAKTLRGIMACEQLQNYLIYSVNVTIMRKTYIGVYTPFYT